MPSPLLILPFLQTLSNSRPKPTDDSRYNDMTRVEKGEHVTEGRSSGSRARRSIERDGSVQDRQSNHSEGRLAPPSRRSRSRSPISDSEHDSSDEENEAQDEFMDSPTSDELAMRSALDQNSPEKGSRTGVQFSDRNPSHASLSRKSKKNPGIFTRIRRFIWQKDPDRSSASFIPNYR